MAVVITVAQQKGGTGKTTLAANLAAALAPSRRVALLDEAGDAQPELADLLAHEGPPHFTLRARSAGDEAGAGEPGNQRAELRRVGAGAADPPVSAGAAGVTIEVSDDGPGVPLGELQRVFEPFHRGEPSRSRETGRVGLGLLIARNIFRAHGGDVVLANRPPVGPGRRVGGMRAMVTLPGQARAGHNGNAERRATRMRGPCTTEASRRRQAGVGRSKAGRKPDTRVAGDLIRQATMHCAACDKRWLDRPAHRHALLGDGFSWSVLC